MLKAYIPAFMLNILLDYRLNYKKNMDRKDLLNSIRMSAAAFALINCMDCKKTNISSSSYTIGLYNTQLTGTTLKIYS